MTMSNTYKYSTTPRESMFSYTTTDEERKAAWEKLRIEEREARNRNKREQAYQDKWGEFQ